MNKIFKHRVFQQIGVICGILLLLPACTSMSERSEGTLFERIPSSLSNISFSNDLSFTDSFNIYTNSNFYAGGGVALGDINNDGLLDIYLAANQKSDKLYLNQGNFEFQDITEKAGVGGTKPWSTGVSMADVNGDGWLDIYVANSGLFKGEDRKNELFINNRDLTFTERAEEFGIADSGNSIHAAFFDYDNDGDLDMYLLNNYASRPIGSYDLQNMLRQERSFRGGDRLYRNELISDVSGDSRLSTESPRFTDVTEKAGIYSSEIGLGLGVSVGDINRDGWMDIYISNDFFERDYLYINNKDGTFREVLEKKLSSISATSMGGDIADLNNDGFPEIFVTDMLPENEERLKTITDFLEWDRYRSEVKMDYHHQFTRNTLHYNNGDGTFGEIGRYAGVEATDWSWGALMADFNLDGLRDIFVPNGFYKDVTDKDHLLNITREKVMKSVVINNRLDYRRLIEMTPTTPVSNYMFENLGDLRFANRASEWGLDEPGFSNGSAYGDLDGDGDPDLVVNNINMEAFVYRNKTTKLYPKRSWIQLVLEGQPPNTFGVGAQVELAANGRYWYAGQMPQRGFQSSMDPVLHIGLGVGVTMIDTLRVRWPDGRVSLKTGVEARRRMVIRQVEAENNVEYALNNSSSEDVEEIKPLLTEITDEMDLNWRHRESSYNDFARSPLLFHMRSTEGPPVCSGDVNGDGRTDFYVGGAQGQPGALFVQESDGGFVKTNQPALEADRIAEDTDCIFFDADGDGTPDLYVASGSSEFPADRPALADRLYRIGGEGKLIRSENALPLLRAGHKPTGVVRTADLDGDGDLDLFVGVRLNPSVYGAPVGGYLLENDGTGQFEDVTDRLAPQLRPEKLRSAGITGAAWGDLNGDSTPDLVIAGEWMPLTVFYNRDGRLERADSKAAGLDNTYGWWQSLALADLNGDGRPDLVGGNHGLNSRFHASTEHPVHMWVGDFDRNGRVEQVFAVYNNGEGPHPVALRHNLILQLPYLKVRYPSYAGYAGQKIREIFTREQLNETVHYHAEQLASVVGWNNGDGSFRIEPLPFRAQLTPIYAILPADLDGNRIPELLIGGNLHAAQPQAGRYDAGYGILLRQDSTGSYRGMPVQESGFFSPGEIRDLQLLEYNGQTLILVSRTNEALQVFKNHGISINMP